MNTLGTLYDKTMLAERLEDLRKGDGRKKHTLQQVSKEIEEKTGVTISHAQIGNYENPEKQDSMSINNLLAFEKYYNVTIDYLLGRSPSKSHNYTTQMTVNKFGLSDKALKNLASMKNNKFMNKNEIIMKLINYMLESDWLFIELADGLVNYYKAKDNSDKKVINSDKQESIAKYDLLQTFEKFRDKSKEEFWDKQYENRPYYLFEIPEQPNIKKKEKENK